MIASTILSLLLPALVSAHGFVNKVSIDGTVYQGNSVGTTPTVSSVIRQVNSNSPVKGASNPDLNCGPGAQLAANVANANPGSTVQVYWVGGTTVNASPWPHVAGPIMHYMAKCQGSCASFNSSAAEWFKISQQGLQSGSTWYMAELQSGSPATVIIPPTLAPGPYLLRSELIALQLAMTQGGAEFYPSCIQLNVGGSQTGQPTSNEEVTFPGGYTDTEPGILTNVYNPPISYTFPGPPLVSFASGGNATSGGSGSSTPPVPSSIAPSPSTVPSPSVVPSPLAMPSSVPPANAGGNPTVAPVPSSPATTGGTATCMRKRSTSPHVVDKKRMHRRRNRTSH